MLYTTKPAAPTLPFPTALPGLGAYIQNPVTGQHATNPSAHRTWTLRSKPLLRAHSKRPIWHTSLTNGPLTPFDNIPLQDRLTQAWLTFTWKKTLSPTQRSAWATFAATYTLTNIYGTTKHLSPFGSFLNVNRLYLYNYVIPGYYSSHSATVRYASPPATWITVPTYTFQNLTLLVKTKGFTPDAYAPWYFSSWIAPPLPTHTIGIMLYISYPHKILTARRQGTLTCCMFQPPALQRATPLLYPTRIYMPALQPGQTVSIAYTSVDYTTPGNSAWSWIQVTAGLNPY